MRIRGKQCGVLGDKKEEQRCKGTKAQSRRRGEGEEGASAENS